MLKKSENFVIISQNKKALRDYFVIYAIEAGISLCGTEVKSIRSGGVNLRDSWCSIRHEEIFMNNAHISAYKHGNIFNMDPIRPRKLLAHKKEILKFMGEIKKKGVSLIPICLYFKKKLVKVKLGLCKGKKIFDKRRVIAKRDADRDLQRTFKDFNNKF
ncbi:MAG: SsrA-binding protein SmpB [Candidatus Improbicoccus devescovinae]|nr:MAG: SsrA-binding protein SmpB [Candidatus Improbicoccus devescovinae]